MPIDAAPAELPIRDEPLAYVARLDARAESLVEGIVVHCTETPDLATARSLGEHLLYSSGTGNSGHYYIDRDGSVWSYVPITRVAHHVRGHNGNTIGIELVNRGRWPRWLDSDHQGMNEPYPDAQIDALIRLLQKLEQDLPQLRWIAGHEDLDRERVPAQDRPDALIHRKLDPGPLFPWPRVLAGTGLQRSTGG
ncbi:MAG: N-acetylmuramoyl-L-alanine amidase [Xanthomonadales bacterium]|nr:N-acetylmuramoyl-L-alanine amidase [Xanthomonadales bacterium]